MRTSPASALKHCDSSNPPQSPSTCFPTHPSPYSCGHRGWKTYRSVADVTEQILPRKMFLHAVPPPPWKLSTLVTPVGRSPRAPHNRECSYHSRLPRVSCARTRFSAVAENPCVFKLSITLVVLAVDEEPPRSSIAILSGLLPWPKVGWSAASATVHLDATS